MEGRRKGVDFRLYTVNPDDKDKQTVMTALSSMKNPDPKCQRQSQDVEAQIGSALDRILISDRVRSCNDFYRTNNKKDMDSSNSMTVN